MTRNTADGMDERRIREAMAALLAAARETGGNVRTDRGDAAMPPKARVSSPRRRTRGPQKAPTKEPVSIRLDRDIVAELRRTGRGWQTRLNELLRDALALDR